jgi:tetratricopeptide (TPR) repeat protein
LEYDWPQEPVCQIGAAFDIERELTLEENQILHFAGHGVYEWGAEGEKKQTGLITGKDRVLDPDFIDKLRYVPQFVFLNCCFGGAIPLNEISPKHIKKGDNAMPSAAKDGRPALAASIAVKFIDAGSKAVIAAGWAVSDGDATRFADCFYDAFLGGDTFADAVTKARKQIFGDASGSDTWSAYQVYGDPQFRLNQGGALQVLPRSTENFVSPRQATLRLRSLQLDARFATTTQQIQRVAQKFRHSLDVVGTHDDWSQHPELFEAVADVHAELGNYNKAIEFYERAVRRSPPSLSVNAVENLLALKVRVHTEKRISTQMTDDRPKLSELRTAEDASIREAIENLEQQEKVAGDRGAALRQSRIGDCHLRRAACQASARGRPSKAPNNMIDKLKDARTAYETSKAYAAGLPEFNINHAVIRLSFTNFLIWKFRPKDKDSVSLDKIMPEVNRIANDLRESEARRAQFDQRRLLAETRLFELVVTKQPSAKLQADLLDTFSQLFMAGGSIRRRREVVSDLYTVAQLLHRVQDLPSEVGETVAALARELAVSIPVIHMK